MSIDGILACLIINRTYFGRFMSLLLNINMLKV